MRLEGQVVGLEGQVVGLGGQVVGVDLRHSTRLSGTKGLVY